MWDEKQTKKASDTSRVIHNTFDSRGAVLYYLRIKENILFNLSVQDLLFLKAYFPLMGSKDGSQEMLIGVESWRGKRETDRQLVEMSKRLEISKSLRQWCCTEDHVPQVPCCHSCSAHGSIN